MTDRTNLLERRPLWVRGLGLVLLTLVVYWPALNGPFLWDDRNWSHGIDWLLNDPSGLSRIWTQVRLLEQYYPVTASSVWLDYQWFGWETFPRHLENLLLHAASCLMLWHLLRRMSIPGAWLAAALLAVHPVAVESVAWITERKNVLCLALSLASLLAWGRSTDWWNTDSGPRVSWYVISLLLFLLALLAKISACVLPPAILIFVWWKKSRVSLRRDLLPVLPMFLAAFALGLLVAWLEKHQAGATGVFFDQLTWAKRFVLAGQALWFYLFKVLWPHPVCVVYHQWNLETNDWWQWAPSIGVIFMIVSLCKLRSRQAWAVFLLFVGPLLPTLGFLNVNGMRFAWVADRWVYFSLPVLCAVIGCLVTTRLPTVLRAPLGTLLLIALSMLTSMQSASYGSLDGFWNKAISGNPHPAVAHTAYGDALMRSGRHQEAMAQFLRALELEPQNGAFHNNLGSLHNAMGKSALAKESFTRAVDNDPSDPLFHYNLGYTLIQQNQIAAAETALHEALRLRPDFLAAHNDLGNLLSSSGRLEEAEKHFEAALEVRPNDLLALGSLGTLRYRQGRKGEALVYYEQVLKIMPDSVPTLTNTARIMSTSLDSSLRDGPRAVELAERAATLSKRQDSGVLNTLAAAYAECGRFPEAVETARKAVALLDASGQPAQSARVTLQVVESGQPVRVADR